MPSFFLQRCLLLLPRLFAAWLVVAVVVELAQIGPRLRGEAAGGQTLGLFQELVAGDLPDSLAAAYGERPAPDRWWQAIATGAWASLRVVALGIVISLAFGPVFGVVLGRFRRWPWVEVLASPIFVAAWLPGFWFASLAVWWMVTRWGQPGYAVSAPATGGPVRIEWLWHAVLVAVPVALAGIGWQIGNISGTLKRNARAPHVRGAFSRGMSGGALFYRHVLRNSLGPLARSIDKALPAMLGVQIVTEWALRYPGIGRLAVESARAPHFAGIFGAGLFFSAILVLARWLGESIAEWLDAVST